MRHSYPNRELMTRFVFCISLYLAFAVQLYAKDNSVQEPSTTYPVGDTLNPVGTPEQVEDQEPTIPHLGAKEVQDKIKLGTKDSNNEISEENDIVVHLDQDSDVDESLGSSSDVYGSEYGEDETELRDLEGEELENLLKDLGLSIDDLDAYSDISYDEYFDGYGYRCEVGEHYFDDNYDDDEYDDDEYEDEDYEEEEE